MERVGRWHDATGVIAQAFGMVLLPLGIWFLSIIARPGEREISRTGYSANWTMPVWGPVVIVAWMMMTMRGVELWFRAHDVSGPETAGINLQVLLNTVRTPETQDLTPRIRQFYPASKGAHAFWSDETGRPWTLTWIGFERGQLSAFVSQIHSPEICMPNAGFQFGSEEPPLLVREGARQARATHQIFRNGTSLINLFVLQVNSSAGREIPPDQLEWTPIDRIKRALAGIRTGRVDIVHLLVPYDGRGADNARESAASYFARLL
jgi:hypothetical protein